jgi:hypothetical protein
MKQNSAEQPYEAYERLKKELEEVKSSIYELKNIRSYDFKITYHQFLGGLFRKLFKLNNQTKLALIEVLESKKQQIENELNNLLNGN